MGAAYCAAARDLVGMLALWGVRPRMCTSAAARVSLLAAHSSCGASRLVIFGFSRVSSEFVSQSASWIRPHDSFTCPVSSPSERRRRTWNSCCGATHVAAPATTPLADSMNGRQHTNVFPIGAATTSVHPAVHDVHDLTELQELTEESLLGALEARFHRLAVYTNTGPVLLAVNPFCRHDELYDNATLQQYATSIADPTSLPPHIYRVAGAAYHAMRTLQTNQSILVGGESGSGKTQSTKHLMEFLVHVGSAHMSRDALSSSSSLLTQHVMDANVVLESFGNARTSRNDNSSRFGKFIQLQFTAGGALLGASIQTYLHEKVRVVNTSRHERNYHVFFELLAGAPAADLATWGLVQPSSSTRADAVASFRYLAQSQCTDRHDHVDDRVMYAQLCRAMASLGLVDDNDGVLRVLAAILHLGNVAFDGAAPDDEVVHVTGHGQVGVQPTPAARHALSSAAMLLGVPLQDLEAAMRTRTLFVAHEVKVLALSVAEACAVRDGLAKALYARLFEWLVHRMNQRLAPAMPADGAPRVDTWIGLLDVFGFEVFATNSFEQLCINFTNEMLHQKFLAHLFKHEAIEYGRQGLAWPAVAFVDNQDCVDLFTARPRGLFALLDEESLLATGTDKAFASKLYRLPPHARLAASKAQIAAGAFTVHHYAGSVEYTSSGFREKNTASLAHDVVALLQDATDSFTRRLGHHMTPPTSSSSSFFGTKPKRHVTSVASQFKGQLAELMDVLAETTPHYVRCLKPNDDAAPRRFDARRVREQLRCNGVLQVVQVTRAGYPVRLSTDAFCARYRLLATESADGDSGKDSVDALLARLVPMLPIVVSHGSRHDERATMLTRGLQRGATKIFLAAKTHAALESRRAAAIAAAMHVLTHAFAGYRWRRLYRQLRFTTIKLQRHVRAKQRRVHMAIRLQAAARMWIARCHFHEYKVVRRGVARLQRVVRARQAAARHRVASLVRVQAFVRMVAARRRFRRTRHAVRVLQRWTRRYCITQHRMLPPPPSPTRFASFTSSNLTPVDLDEILHGGPISPPARPTFLLRPTLQPLRASSMYVRGPALRASAARFAGIDYPVDSLGRPTALHLPSQPSSPAFEFPVPPSKQMLSSRSYRSGPILPELKLRDVSTLAPLAEFFACAACIKRFTLFRRKYHCRSCGDVVCGTCSTVVALPKKQSARVCLVCSALHSPAAAPEAFSSVRTLQTLDSNGSSNHGGEAWHRAWPEPPLPPNEGARLDVVAQLDVEMLREDATIQHMVTMVYHSWPGSVAFVSLMGASTQVVLSKMGSHFPDELARDVAFCAHTICAPSALVVPDATKDPRFAKNPLVQGNKGRKFRFYMGAPLVDDRSQQVVGTIAVLHTAPRKTTVQEWEMQVLENFAMIVSQQVAASWRRRPH
ncbi:Aste57867_22925 [Aphanomyces stellatus]|uniref:Aste57867_22925 protein n=1 Tax=Aphanomyces stellatus TaxID=120398 RepID=A0A485LN83_9STRA|nr:hypothetical protein As57867_022854 [Aphanomyces stellatus]VFT99575.1 Aste57867_22925 [Aphanomyces stellatus]